MDERQVPDLYADQFRINLNPWGANLMFARTQPDQPKAGVPQSEDVAIIRMSHEHLKVLTMILRRQLKGWEDNTQIEIQIPFEVLNSLGLSKEDW